MKSEACKQKHVAAIKYLPRGRDTKRSDERAAVRNEVRKPKEDGSEKRMKEQ